MSESRPQILVTSCLVIGSAIGCATAPPPRPPPPCAAPCAVVDLVRHPDTVQLHLHVGEGTRLHNATVTSAAQPGCTSGVPVVAVTLGEMRALRTIWSPGPTEIAEGPAVLPANATLVLRFPFTQDSDQPELALPAPHSVDLDLKGGAGARCLRVPLPAPAAGWLAVVSQLSFRQESPP